jgi:hypothetical protein
MTNYRITGYLLVALSLINWRYQTGHHNIAVHSITILVPGLLLLGFTFTKNAGKYLARKNVQITIGVIAALLVAYSFLN